jgi:hypothetical protein
MSANDETQMQSKDTATDQTQTGSAEINIPTWVWVLLGIFVAGGLLFGAYITLIKWKALATDPQAVKQVALGQFAGNTFSNIFGPRRV